MVYYARHTRLLYDVYKKVGDRLNNELMAQGGSSMSMAQYGENIASGDTASIWKGDMCFALTPYQADNIYTYEAKADTSYHKGDRLILDFDAQFVYQEGVRNADSVASEVSQLTSSSHYHIQIEDTRKVGIKDVKGYFMLGNSLDEGPSTTLRLAVFYNIQLLKMHIKEAAADNKNAAAPLNGAQTDMQPLPSASGSCGACVEREAHKARQDASHRQAASQGQRHSCEKACCRKEDSDGQPEALDEREQEMSWFCNF